MWEGGDKQKEIRIPPVNEFVYEVEDNLANAENALTKLKEKIDNLETKIPKDKFLDLEEAFSEVEEWVISASECMNALECDYHIDPKPMKTWQIDASTEKVDEELK